MESINANFKTQICQGGYKSFINFFMTGKVNHYSHEVNHVVVKEIHFGKMDVFFCWKPANKLSAKQNPSQITLT